MNGRRAAEIVVVGSIALDTVHTRLGTARRVMGGSAAYFSLVASLFAKVRVVAVVGEDFPEEGLALLAEKGVDLSGVETAPGESFFWEGSYAPDFRSRATLRTKLGVFSKFEPMLGKEHRAPDCVFLANIDPRLQLRVLDQAAPGTFAAVDTMDYWIREARGPLLELLPRTRLLIVNEDEARQLSGQGALDDAARWILDRGPDWAAIKMGRKGSKLYARSGAIAVPAAEANQVVDPTGAGDAYAGGLLGVLAQEDRGEGEGARMERALRAASAAGAVAVETFSVDSLRRMRAETLEARGRKLVLDRVPFFAEPVLSGSAAGSR